MLSIKPGSFKVLKEGMEGEGGGKESEHTQLRPDAASASETGSSGSTSVRVTVLSPHGQPGQLPVKTPHLSSNNFSRHVEITGRTSDSQSFPGCATREPPLALLTLAIRF